MRSLAVIKELFPCDNNLADPRIRALEDAKKVGQVLCSNIFACQVRSRQETIFCVRRMAQQMAGFAVEKITNGQPIAYAIESEVQDYLLSGPDGKFWTIRNGQWIVVEGKKNVVEDIAVFAQVVLGR